MKHVPPLAHVRSAMPPSSLLSSCRPRAVALTRPRTPLALVTLGTLLLLSLLSLLTIPVHAEERAAAPPAFGDVLDVRVVNLEAVVTRKGDRVQGLTADRFRLLVDGQEVPIEYFSEVAEGQGVPGADAVATVPSVAPGKAVGTRYLVFVDDYFAIPAYRNRVLRQLERQLSLLGPADRMAIVAFDGRQVEMLTSWTRSLTQLESAFEVARKRPAYGLQRYSEQRFDQSVRRYDLGGPVGSRFSNVGFGGARRGFYSGTGSYPPNDRIGRQVARVVSGASSALRAFARPPGRKVMLLLSGGWPAATFDWPARAEDATGVPLYGHQIFSPLVDTANRLGYTLYPVDLQGSQRTVYGSAELGSVAEAQLAQQVAREVDWVEEDSLVYLADETGGRAFLDGAANVALERVVEDVRSYYWLGFTPRWQEDDRRHKVRLELRDRGYDVRLRESFLDLSRQTEVTMLVESAQLLELPLPGAPLDVRFGEPVRSGYKKVLLPLHLTIPLQHITLLPSAEGFRARLELRVAATDQGGDRSEIPTVPIDLLVPKDAGSTVVYETQLLLRKKPHRLVLSLYDVASGEMFTRRADVDL